MDRKVNCRSLSKVILKQFGLQNLKYKFHSAEYYLRGVFRTSHCNIFKRDAASNWPIFAGVYGGSS
jgi:hypothetical protein